MGATAVIAGVSTLLQSIHLGPKETTGLPQIPSNDTVFNNALATKWCTYYFTNWGSLGGLQHNIDYWAEQIREDGPARAWANFSTSKVIDPTGVQTKAVALSSQIGGPLVLAPAMPQPTVAQGGVPALTTVGQGETTLAAPTITSAVPTIAAVPGAPGVSRATAAPSTAAAPAAPIAPAASGNFLLTTVAGVPAWLLLAGVIVLGAVGIRALRK